MSQGLGENIDQASSLRCFTSSGTNVTRKLREAESGRSGNMRDDKQDLAECPDTGVSQGLGVITDQASSLQCFTSSGTKFTRDLHASKSGWSGIEEDESLVEVSGQDDESCSKPGRSTTPVPEREQQLVQASTDKCNSFTGTKSVGHHYLGYALCSS